MKKIHKKIGAMALAGMVVLGGGALSGKSRVHADSSKSGIHLLGKAQQELYEYDNKIFKKHGYDVRAIAVSNQSSFHRKALMDKFIEGYIKKASNKNLKKRLLQVPIDCGDEDISLELELKSLKKKGEKMSRLVFDGIEYLIIRR